MSNEERERLASGAVGDESDVDMEVRSKVTNEDLLSGFSFVSQFLT